jgi:hypothetical protein
MHKAFGGKWILSRVGEHYQAPHETTAITSQYRPTLVAPATETETSSATASAKTLASLTQKEFPHASPKRNTGNSFISAPQLDTVVMELKCIRKQLYGGHLSTKETLN